MVILVILVTENPKKFLLCFKIIKWFFSIFLFQVAKKLKKKRVLYFNFAFNRQAVYIKTKADNQENGDLQDYPVVGFVECNTFFTH